MSNEGFDFEALDEENEMSASIIGQDDAQLSESARYVTVLSDFGEAEQFLIEGDSILQLAFEDDRLDWQHGGQYLHLIYVIEKIVSQFFRRGAHFSFIFFESHQEIWKETGSKRFARTVLISHLKSVLKSPAAITCFTSPDSEQWVDFLLSYQPAFIGISGAHDLLSRFAKNCHFSGISILYLSQLEFLDHSVKGFYVQSGCAVNYKAFRTMTKAAEPKTKQDMRTSVMRSECLPTHLAKDWRILVCCHACSAWLSSCQADKCSLGDCEAIAKIFLVHIVLVRQGNFSIQDRSLAKFSLPDEISNIIRKFNDFVGDFISESGWDDISSSDPEKFIIQKWDLIDFSDGRLQCSIADKVLRLESANPEDFNLGSEVTQILDALWRFSSPEVSEIISIFPLRFGPDACSAARILRDAEETGEKLKARIVQDPSLSSDCNFASKILDFSNGPEGSPKEIPVEFNATEEKGWKFTESLDSFLWTHCKDQSASADSSRSTTEWERKRQLRWKARQSQMYFRHLHDYAASLAGTTVLGSTCISSGEEGEAHAPSGDDTSSIASEQSVDSKQSKGRAEKKKPEKKLSKKEQLLADIEAKKQKGASQKLELEWNELKLAIKKSTSSVAKLKDLDDFIIRCLAANQMSLGLEVTLQKLNESKLAWQEDRDSKSNNMKFAILTVETIRNILSTYSELLRDPKPSVASEARSEVIQTMISLGFVDPALQLSRSFLDPSDRESYSNLQEETKELARTFRNKLSVGSRSMAHFQLEHMGYLLPRPAPKVKDPRITSFTPDEWQRTLLDVVDSRESALVCAPTSSGKTFISYYCMEKVMRDTAFKDGVLVFVAPTKALINQIAAQVYGK